MNWRHKRQDVAEEIEAHLEERIDDLVELGLPRSEALAQARREFGNQVLVTESSREVWGWMWLDRLNQDLRYALRMLRRSPGFTATAVLSLGLGIGANTAIFTLMEAALWKPMPVQHAEQLRLLSWSGRDNFGSADVNIMPGGPWPWGDDRPTPDGGIRHTSFTWSIYEALLRGNTVFDSVFGLRDWGRLTAVVDGSAEAVNCFLVSGSFYPAMQISPALGRRIEPATDVGTAEGAVVMISYEYWMRRFGGDPSVIGKTITLNGAPVTVIGVNPASFNGIEPGSDFEIWAPLSLLTRISPRQASLIAPGKPFWLTIMGRIRPGVSDVQARSALDVILQRQIEADFPGMRAASHLHLNVEPGGRGVDYLGRYGKPLLILLSLAGLVLLGACANVANLLLSKSAARRREIGVRLALGAGRARVVRQLLTEGLLLACVAGVAGLLFGWLARDGILALLGTYAKPTPFTAPFDGRVLLISLGITFLTGLLFSVAPAWQSRTVALNEALKGGATGTAGLSGVRGGKLLVVFQVALSLLLLVGTGLFVRTFRNLKSSPTGIDARSVLLFRLDPPALRYSADRAAKLFAQVRERTSAIPGIRSATYSAQAMLAHSISGARVTLPGEQWIGDSAAMASDIQVGEGFFRTMGIPILYGRPLDERDGPDAPRAAVVTSEFGRHFFGENNPVGRTFTINGGTGPYRIVGVCPDARYDFLGDPARQSLFRYFPQTPRARAVTFEVKVAGAMPEVVQQIRRVVNSLDPGLAVTDVRMQVQQIDDTLSQQRLLAALASAFGVLALLLGCIGVYGVSAYAVVRRTNEIGIRVALGARPQRVTWMVLRETVLLSGTGFLIGLPTALAMSRFTNGFLYGLKPDDPLNIWSAVLALVTASFLAAYVPARGAARIDPMIALRHE